MNPSNAAKRQGPDVNIGMLVEGTVPSEWFFAMKNERDSLRAELRQIRAERDDFEQRLHAYKRGER